MTSSLMPNAGLESLKGMVMGATELATPRTPETLEETGLPASLVEQLVFKILHFRGDVTGRELAAALGLRFSLIDDLLETWKRQQLVHVRKSLGMGNVSAIFSLTENGRLRARDCLDLSQYAGHAPVPLAQYTDMVRRQRQKSGWLTPARLREAYNDIIISADVLAQIGPAVASGNSFLIYGQPGNGKTFLAEALVHVDESPVFIPYAIEYQGTIVQVYDPIYHKPIDDGASESFFTESMYDKRWFKSRRPFLVTGGELTLDMLDLSYNSGAKTYDAPFQVKANNGIYLIDDFGRQRATPAEVLNRWIVPMERRVDYLSFVSGGKMTVPFEAFLVFSTNLKPSQLGDEAFLRRIQYKMHLRNPDAGEYKLIFEQFCRNKELPYDPAIVDEALESRYQRTAKPLRRCHPRDVLSHAIDSIHFEQKPYVLTREVLDHAFSTCFATDSED